MEQERRETSILHLTLEIIYLLTGEDYTVVKKTCGECVAPSSSRSGGWSRARGPIMEPPPPSLIPERNNEQKILELTHKMMELLTGEVPIRCQDVAVYFSMEEWEYVGGHKDLYQEAMMEDHRPLTSPDGSSKRNPPERCPAPLDPQDCPGGDDTVLQEEQDENLDLKIKVIEEGEEEGEELNVRSDRPFKEEDVPTDIITPDGCSKDLGQNVLSSTDPEGDENNIPDDYPKDTQYICSGCGKWFKPELDEKTHIDETQIKCSECRKCSKQKSGSIGRQKAHKKSYSCLECGRNFTKKSHLVEHKKIHTGEKLYSCSECGKSFTKKSNLVQHQKLHTGEKPYSCSECGKKFTKRYGLVNHHWIHKGEKPFSCLECGKSFTQKSDLVKHYRSHTGERPFPCLECGKFFTQRSVLAKHKRIHQEVVTTVLHNTTLFTY
ncbi:oocyte zinc finger protein XlCOF7.1-like [Dendropsophus ebraccatus]|uniref:oocyte zinc finger protein XlCOF7.1-like n=1 Tax=Dendropsophus ebraccatus TaxID=150705 RepID=UPI00383217FD